MTESRGRHNWLALLGVSGLVAALGGATSVGVIYGRLDERNSRQDELNVKQDERIKEQGASIERTLSKIETISLAVQAGVQRLEMHEYRIGKLESIAERQQETTEALKRGQDDLIRAIEKHKP